MTTFEGDSCRIHYAPDFSGVVVIEGRGADGELTRVELLGSDLQHLYDLTMTEEE